MTLGYRDLGIVKLFTHQKSNLVDAMESSQHGMGFPSGSVPKSLPANAGDARDMVSIPGSGRSPGGESDNPLQYSCLGNSMDGGTWEATVHGVTEPNTTQQLNNNKSSP